MSRALRALGAPSLCSTFLLLLAPISARGAGESPATVSLSEILSHAEHHAPPLAIARARQELGLAEVTAASVLLPDNPELELGGGPRVGVAGVGFEVTASLAQTIEIAGQRSLRVDAAQRDVEVGRLRLAEARWQVHRAVHEAFHAALLARERAAMAARVFEFASRLHGITRRRLEAGEVSQVQLRLANGELAQARQARVETEGVARIARLRLAEVSGWPTDNPPRVSGHLDEPRHAPAWAEIVARAQRRNPGLRTGNAALTAARARAAAAERAAWPSPTLGIGYAHEREAGEASGMHVGLVSLSVPLPLWDRNQGERARAVAQLSVAQAELAAAQFALVAELAAAHAAVDVAADRIQAFGGEIIPAFAGNLSLLERAYELGEIDLLQVMVARARFLEVERDALAAYGDYFAAVARLESLLGTEIWADEHHRPSSATGTTP